ncbi:MAG: PilZ domain-containing protein [Spirochaetales bacterium]|nr:PilZ domain-containing protein [Spirochaetales bacterium]
MDLEEKRRNERLYITIDVEFDISIHQHWVTSSVKNISVNGICLLTKEYLPIGSLLYIKFRIPDVDTMINVTGEVIWHGEHSLSDDKYYENGIKFIEIKSSYKELIGKFIEGITFEKRE